MIFKSKVSIVVFILIYLNQANLANGQNIVSNPDFESYNFCPTDQNQLNYSNDWLTAGGTPDYFNSCSPSCASSLSCVGVPENYFGFQPSFNGNGYAGLFLFSHNDPFEREYISTNLNTPLVAGTEYFVSAWICRSNGVGSFGASNNFGFRFYTNYTYPNLTDNFSHINDTTIVTDSINWTHVYGSFVADSAYQYLTIGNFYESQFTDTENIGPFNYAYYYVDHVCVSINPTTCDIPMSIKLIAESENSYIYPNPCTEVFFVKQDSKINLKIFLYDLSLRQLKNENINNQIPIEMGSLKSGIYFYEIIENGFILKQGKLVKL